MKNPPLLLLGLGLASVAAMMAMGASARPAPTPDGPPPGPLEPPGGAGTPGTVVIPAGRRAIITMSFSGDLPSGSTENIEKQLRVMIESPLGIAGKLENLHIHPSIISFVMTAPKDAPMTVNTPATMTMAGKTTTSTLTVSLL